MCVRWAGISGILLVLAAGIASAQTAPTRVLLTVNGTQPGEGLGSEVADAGDLNGDGFPDFAIGAPFFGLGTADGTGRVLVYFGGPRMAATPPVVLDGEGSGHRFGSAIAGMGDVNGDGYDDLLVGAPGYPNPGLDREVGRAYLFLGSPGFDPVPDGVLPAPTAGVAGTWTPLRFGADVAGLGDVNGDGFPDWAVAYDSSAVRGGDGDVFLYLGGRVPSLQPEPTPYPLGESIRHTVVSRVGDINGDGRADIGVGEPLLGTGNSRFRVQEDPFGTFYSTGKHMTGVGLGSSLAPAGDIDGDGLDDFLVGAPMPGNRHALLVFGVPMGVYEFRTRPILGAVGADSFGCAVASGSFAEGEAPFFAVGAASDDYLGTNGGAFYLYRSRGADGVQFLRSVRTMAGDRLGYAIAATGDVDDNGEQELLVGAPGHAAGAGRALLYSLGAHTLLEPEGPHEREAGGPLEFRWTGTALADLYLSYDGGVSWNRVANRVGGAEENVWSMTLPDTATTRARACVIASSGQPWRGADTTRYEFSIRRPVPLRPVASARDTLREPPAPAPSFGRALASGADWTGDGHEDVVAGIPHASPAGFRSGRVWVRPADPAGGTDLAIDGESPGEEFGSAVALGDLDGDGLAELLAGAPRHGVAPPAAGRVRVFRGGATGEPPRVLDGRSEGEAFGAAVAFLGDWSADGTADFAVAAPRSAAPDTAGSGRVAIYSGYPASGATPVFELHAPHDAVDFGATLQVLDFNGDGAPDLAVATSFGSYAHEQVLVYFGGPGADAVPDRVLTSPGPFERFGAALHAGDVTGDGVDDLLVGAPEAVGGFGPTGRAYLFVGGPDPVPLPTRVYDGREAGERFGAAVHVAADPDPDGVRPVIVGAPEADFGAGACRSFRGTVPGNEWLGSAPEDRFGSAITARTNAGSFAALVASPGPSSVEAAMRPLLAIGTPRYAIELPGAGARWFGGGSYVIRWKGAEPADVSLSLDGGTTWTEIAAATGGAAANAIEFRAPSQDSDSALIRIRPADAVVPGEAVAGRFSITTAVSLESFEFELGEDGASLSWQALPGLGPQGWTGYRLYRMDSATAAEERVGPPLLTGTEWLDPGARRGATYLLRAVDGFGDEVELGRLTIPPGARGIRAWPMPSDEFGPIRLAMFPPVDATGRTPGDFSVTLYDLAGRSLRRIAGGRVPSRVGEVALEWDRRDFEGRIVRPGVYFIRAAAPSSGWEERRRIVLLR